MKHEVRQMYLALRELCRCDTSVVIELLNQLKEDGLLLHLRGMEGITNFETQYIENLLHGSNTRHIFPTTIYKSNTYDFRRLYKSYGDLEEEWNMNKEILEEIKLKLEKHTGIEFSLEKICEDEYKFVDMEGRIFTHVELWALKEFGELTVSIGLNETVKNFEFPCIMLKVDDGSFYVDMSHKFKGLSIQEIKERYDHKEFILHVTDRTCDIVTMDFVLTENSNLNLIRVERRNMTKGDNTISSEGSEDIKFYEKDNRYFERETGKEIISLLDIGGQYCERLIPILK